MKKNLITKLGFLAVGLVISVAAGLSINNNKTNAIETKATTGDVDMSKGVYNISSTTITWTLDDIIEIKHYVGSGSESVVSNNPTNPRVYTGHILSFKVTNTDYAIESISINYYSTSCGGILNIGTTTVGDSVVDDVDNVARTLDTASGGTHYISAVPVTGLEAIYIHNTANETKRTLRPIGMSITYFKKDIKYNVSFDPNGGIGDQYQLEVPRSNYVIPGCEFTAPVDKYFSHWTIDSASFNPNDTYPLKTDITLVAQWGDMSYNWKKVDINDIHSNDIIVFVSTNSDGKSYALPNDCGTNNPSAINVRIENGYIVSEVSDALKWNIKNEDEKITFYPYSINRSWLYCLDDDEGLNVGADSGNNTFTLDSGYYKNTTVNRFMGVYNETDWRAYTTYEEFSGQTFNFYKYTALDTYSQLVLDLTGTICETPDPKEGTEFDAVWSDLTNEFNNLLENYKVMFKEATADAEGSILEQAVARYDYLVAKYNLNDFAERNPTPASPTGDLPILINNNMNVLIIITSLGLTTLLLCFVIKNKRKRCI